MQHNLKTRHTVLVYAVTAATAMIGALASTQALAYSEIPLTMDEARTVADAALQSSIAAGVSTTHITGNGQASAQAWNGYNQAKTAADVDVNLQGGEGLVGWSVQGADLGTPIPEITGKYGVASQWDVDGRFKRFRHVSSDIGVFPELLKLDKKADQRTVANRTILEQVHDVYAVNGRVFIAPEATITAGYQLDTRSGGNSLSIRDTSPQTEMRYGIDDQHHQVKVGSEYLGDNWTVGANYYMSKYDNSNEFFAPWILKNGSMLAARTLDPSSTFHRIGFTGTYQPLEHTTLSFNAGYAWSQSDVDSPKFLDKTIELTQLSTSVRLPEFSVGLSSRPMDPLSVKLDYSYRKFDQRFSSDPAQITYQSHGHETPESVFNGTYSEHKISSSAIYNLTHGYSAKLHGKFVKRDYEEAVKTTKSYVLGLELRKRLSNMLSGSVGYSYRGRSSSFPEGAEAFTSNLLGYDQHGVDVRLTSTPIDSLTVSFLGSVYTRDYKVEYYTTGERAGEEASSIKDMSGLLLGLDVDWAPSRDWNIFAFYNFNRLKSTHTSDFSYTPYGSDVSSPIYWNEKPTSNSHTFGLGFGLHPQNHPWKATVRYVYGYDTDDYYLGNMLMDANSKTHYATASLDYQLNKSWSMMGVAMYGHGASFDPHRNEAGYVIGQPAVDLTTSPNYNAFGVFVGVKYLLP